ncbi:MAG: orotate phosphoribosyltransferase [Bacteriovoracaceae bacterium]|nr:orotate phosphoribosyltransferase [Bacteriovoracaceae bacterium]
MNNIQNKQPTEEFKINWTAACHASALLGVLLPFGNIIGPVALWIVNKDKYPEVMNEGKIAINFQTTISLALFALGAVISILSISHPMMAYYYLSAHLTSWIPIAFAGFKSYKLLNGERFEYPFSFRFIK